MSWRASQLVDIGKPGKRESLGESDVHGVVGLVPRPGARCRRRLGYGAQRAAGLCLAALGPDHRGLVLGLTGAEKDATDRGESAAHRARLSPSATELPGVWCPERRTPGASERELLIAVPGLSYPRSVRCVLFGRGRKCPGLATINDREIEHR
jgi:hypothetical protein